MIQIATVYFNELEDCLLAPFYLEKQRLKGFDLKLGDIVFSITNGIDLRKFSDEGTLYFRISDIKRSQINLLTAKKVKINLFDIPKKTIVHQGDLLMSRKGTPGITTLATEFEEQGIIGTEIIKIVLKKKSQITPEFLFIYLNHKSGFNQITSKLTGTVSRGINHPSLKSIKIPKIDPRDQKTISEKIRKIFQKHVSALLKIEQAKKLLEQALGINHLVIKENKTYSVNYYDLTDILTPKFYYPKYLNTLKEIKKKFKTVKLGEVADIKRGNEVGSKNYRKYVDKKNSDVPFIRTSDLVNYEIDNYPDYFIDEAIFKELKQDLKAKDIIYTKDGKIGLCAILTDEDKCIIASGLARIRVKKEFDPYYLFLVLSSFIGYYQAMQRLVVASTLPHLQQERLSEIEIPIIEKNTYNKISQLVSDAFTLKTEKKKLLREAFNKVEELVK